MKPGDPVVFREAAAARAHDVAEGVVGRVVETMTLEGAERAVVEFDGGQVVAGIPVEALTPARD